MKNLLRFSVAAAFLLALSACETREAANLPSAQPPTNIRSSDGTYSSAHPVSLEVYWYKEPKAVLTASGVKDGKVVSLVAQWDPQQLSATSLAAAVSQGPLANGVANISAMSPKKELTQAAGGTVSLSRQQGRVSGSAQAGDLSFDFDGNLVVSCWVPSSALSNAPPLTLGADGDSEALTQDFELRTPQCARFKDW